MHKWVPALILFFLLIPGAVFSQSAPVKIMPLGDSITELHYDAQTLFDRTDEQIRTFSGGYRYPLFFYLKKEGITNFDFVGSNHDQWAPTSCTIDKETLPNCTFDRNNEGHSGWTAGGIANSTRGWVTQYQPDIILLHIGTNDVLGNGSITNVYTDIGKIIDEARAAKPNVTIFLAKIIPLDPSIQASKSITVTQVNEKITQIYNEKNNTTSKIILVDQNTGFDGRAKMDTYDGIHANPYGGKKMAQRFLTVLRPYLSGQPQPTAAPGSTATPRPVQTSVPQSLTIPVTPAQFYRGINLNGGPIIIDGKQWQSEPGASITVDSNRFKDKTIPLNPPTTPEKTSMIRDALWGNNGKPSITINNVSNGIYAVYLYIWEDNFAQNVNVAIQGITVVQNLNSGSPGSWRRSGPFAAAVTDGTIKINGFGTGDLNISGVEIWTANGAVTTGSPTLPLVTTAVSPSLVPTAGSVNKVSMKGLKVQGNKVVNDVGQSVRLIGTNVSGTEYSCVGGGGYGHAPWGIFEVPPTQATIDGFKKWNINTVRIPLNEACWLGIEPDTRTNIGINTNTFLTEYRKYSGETYRTAIQNWVNLLAQNNIASVVEIHWSAPGRFLPRGLAPMPSRDNTVTAWKDIANRFKGNSSVIFDVYNEPFHRWGSNEANNSVQAWTCWKKGSGNGTDCSGMDEWYDLKGNSFQGGGAFKYQVAGMDELVGAIRGTGATNMVMLGGMMYANNLTRWLESKPADNNILASWHSYNGSTCNNQACWDSVIKPIAQQVPVIAGEIGMATKNWDGSTLPLDYIKKIMPFMDANNIHYLGWTWNKWGCEGHQMVKEYDGSINTGCAHSEDLYAAMQKSLAQNPGTPVPTTAPDCTKKALGDANCDSKTSLVDFELFRRGLFKKPESLMADFNGDKVVTLNDYRIWLTNFIF